MSQLLMSLRCALLGHRYFQLANIAIKPERWTHSISCLHCGKTINFVNAPEEKQ